MSDNPSYRIDNSQGKRAYLNKLRETFAERERSAREKVRTKHRPHVEFLEKRGLTLDHLREAGARKMATGALAGLMVVSPISGFSQAVAKASPVGNQVVITSQEDMGYKLAQELKKVVPDGYQNLSPEQEQAVSKVFTEVLNVRANAEI